MQAAAADGESVVSANRPEFNAGRSSWVRRSWVEVTAGAFCFAWAFIAWLTVIPNQDILVDGIQAQSLIAEPRLVLAFPGQKHGGPLEYPVTVLAEGLAPGNYFANAAVRPLLAFLTGFLVARLFLRLFPAAPRWSLLAAIAVGPTIIHGKLGPQDNPVGVWWLQPNWDMAWLLVTGGALAIAGLPGSRGPMRRALLGGLLVGLGFWAHPAIVLLIVPLAALVILVARPRIHLLAVGVLGAVAGVVPAAVSYVVNARVNTWDPSHGAFIALDYYRDMGSAVFGLNGIPDYMFALLPYGLGLAPSNAFLSGPFQSTIVWFMVVIIMITAAASIAAAVHRKRWLSLRGSVATAWVIAMGTMMAFITFIDPVWIYSSGLAVLFWLSVGVLPDLIGHRVGGVLVTIGVLALAAVSTASHNADYLTSLPERFEEKVDVQERNKALAERLLANDVDVVFGSYYDAVPIGYASGQRLRTVTTTYNRFPLTAAESAAPFLRVAVDAQPTDGWGEDALRRVRAACREVAAQSAANLGDLAIFDCPPMALAEAKP